MMKIISSPIPTALAVAIAISCLTSTALFAQTNPSTPPNEPIPDEFVMVEKEAEIDYADIQKKLVYPEIARQAGIEGKVVLRVLIGKDGKPKTHMMLESTHEWFTEPAVKAVMQARCTPAILEGKPVEMWMTVPITFQLGNGTSNTPLTALISELNLKILTDSQHKALHTYNRGLVYYKANIEDKADDDFEEAQELDNSTQWKPYSEAGLDDILRIDIDPKNGRALAGRAALLSEYSTEQAIAGYTAALDRFSNYPDALIGRAELYYRTEKYDRAMADITILPNRNVSTARIQYFAALVELRTGKPLDDVQRRLQKAEKAAGGEGIYHDWAISELRTMVQKNERATDAQKLLREVFGEQ